MIRLISMLALACLTAGGQTPDPAADPLAKAYEALRTRRYDTAIGHFRQAVQAAPARPAIRKDLAYAYLKIGETEAARDQFAEAVRLEPADSHAALEYAFLCHETGRTATARHIFDQVRRSGDPTSRETAEQAFQNIDRPLGEGIERWTQALRSSPDDFSAYHELARLAEQREDYALAAEHYRQAWQRRPELRDLLVKLGRMYKALGREEQAMAALLAASRGKETRAAEEARALLPRRYPYVYEFRDAVALDAANIELRRELAYLLLAMDKQDEAVREFEALLKAAPADSLAAAQLRLLRRPAQPPRAAARTDAGRAKEMAERSYQAGYLRDALKYYTMAHEDDPLDFSVLLRLGWTNNLLHRDDQAVRWFALARKSAEASVAREARQAHENLRPSLARFRTTLWLFPSYSSRWRDMFTYGQAKAEMKLGNLPLRSYLSVRFIGDTRAATGEARPEYLSESSFIFGGGMATDPLRGFTLWGEAGSAAGYRRRPGSPRLAPDYRGGVSFNRGLGRLLRASSHGLFAETNDDGVFLSRYQNDFLVYSQNRFGLSVPAIESLGGLQAQVYWNGNASTDLRSQYWANVVETGPGVRFRWKAMPSAWIFSVNLLRGAYTRNEGNPRRPNFTDVRVGMWYAFTK